MTPLMENIRTNYLHLVMVLVFFAKTIPPLSVSSFLVKASGYGDFFCFVFVIICAMKLEDLGHQLSYRIIIQVGDESCNVE